MSDDAPVVGGGRNMAAAPPTAWVDRMMRGVTKTASSAWLVVGFLAFWEIFARIKELPHFPPLTEIIIHFREDWLGGDVTRLFLTDYFWENAGPSVVRFFEGWMLAVVGGMAFGVMLGRSRVLAALYNPAIRFAIATPKTVLLPLAVTFFGVNDRMNVFLIFIGTVWVVLINTMDAVATIDKMWLRSARSLGINRRQLLFRVVLPAASPQILAGIRVSLGVGLILMVISELYATTSGIGYQISLAQRTFKYLDMWSAILLIGVLGIAINALYGIVESKLLRWHRREI